MAGLWTKPTILQRSATVRLRCLALVYCFVFVLFFLWCHWLCYPVCFFLFYVEGVPTDMSYLSSCYCSSHSIFDHLPHPGCIPFLFLPAFISLSASPSSFSICCFPGRLTPAIQVQIWVYIGLQTREQLWQLI